MFGHDRGAVTDGRVAVTTKVGKDDAVTCEGLGRGFPEIAVNWKRMK
jgi:hypothetical protein